MKQRLVVLSLLLLALPTWGEPGGPGSYSPTPDPQKKPKVTMEYIVTNSEARNTIKVENSAKWAPDMAKWMSDIVVPKIRKLPTVGSIQFIKGKEVVDETYKTYNWADYVPSTRDSHMLVQFQFSTPMSMLFKVTESRKTCKNATASKPVEDEFGGGGQVIDTDKSPCRLETKMDVTGPIAIYGTFAGPLNQTLLLQNQLTLSWYMGSDYSQTGMEIYGSMSTNNPNFQQALLKVLEYARFRPVFAEQFAQNPVRPTMKQAVRVIRSINEEILRGK